MQLGNYLAATYNNIFNILYKYTHFSTYSKNLNSRTDVRTFFSMFNFNAMNKDSSAF